MGRRLKNSSSKVAQAAAPTGAHRWLCAPTPWIARPTCISNTPSTSEDRMALERYVVVSSDGHCGGEIHEYKDYLAKEWHDEFEAWVATYQSPFADTVSATAKRNWDSDFRIREMNADGITGEVLFPNTIPPFFTTVGIIGIGLPKSQEEFRRRWAGLKAHNRWLVEFCSKEQDRRRGLIQVFPNDVDAILDEIRWAQKHRVLG